MSKISVDVIPQADGSHHVAVLLEDGGRMAEIDCRQVPFGEDPEPAARQMSYLYGCSHEIDLPSPVDFMLRVLEGR